MEAKYLVLKIIAQLKSRNVSNTILRLMVHTCANVVSDAYVSRVQDNIHIREEESVPETMKEGEIS